MLSTHYFNFWRPPLRLLSFVIQLWPVSVILLSVLLFLFLESQDIDIFEKFIVLRSRLLSHRKSRMYLYWTFIFWKIWNFIVWRRHLLLFLLAYYYCTRYRSIWFGTYNAIVVVVVIINKYFGGLDLSWLSIFPWVNIHSTTCCWHGFSLLLIMRVNVRDSQSVWYNLQFGMRSFWLDQYKICTVGRYLF